MKSLIGMLVLGGVLAVSACGDNRVDPDRRYLVEPRASASQMAGLYPNETPALRKLIIQSARENEVPVELVQRIIVRESTHRPGARNGPYYGLMQILPATARGMGYQGSPQGLLDAETNLKYAVKYLRGAYMVADGNQDAAVKWYSRGYYYEAKKKGLLQATGLR
ncbi:transglycosylase SLT domain-containing protein [Paracoccus mangrovi]|jgi:soluble lytic murein transglycosylase-like protein|uniref:Transglycosylase SLT domain-containing protein n=1 Tax=Paracoccus mangrovi TaxID=1715645 RepID=A0ABV7R1T6_9RHOB